jgi:hypothetical protein
MSMIESEIRALHPMPGLAWTQVRDDAVAFADHGWPVVPGTYQLAEHGAWLGKPQATGLEPIADDWTIAATSDPTVAMDWWTRRPYSVLLACGTTVDAFEVPKAHGQRVLDSLRSSRALGPVAVTPCGSLLVFAKVEPLDAAQMIGLDIRWYSDGSWVPLPPTSRAGVPHRWRLAPAAVGWRVPAGSVPCPRSPRGGDAARPDPVFL